MTTRTFSMAELLRYANLSHEIIHGYSLIEMGEISADVTLSPTPSDSVGSARVMKDVPVTHVLVSCKLSVTTREGRERAYNRLMKFPFDI